MGTINLVAGTGVADIEFSLSWRSGTFHISAGGNFEFTRLDSNSWIRVEDATGKTGYGGPYYANGTNIGGGGGSAATFYYSSSRTITITATAKRYTVSYYSNAGSDTVYGMPSSQTKYYGTTLTLSTNKPVRTGYTFLGWGTSSSTHDVSYAPGAAYTQNANISLYAIWIVSSYTLSFDENGGTGSMSSLTGATSYTLPSCGFSRTGYRFIEWNTRSDGTGSSYEVGETITLTAHTTVYAIWTRISYNVTFFANAGSDTVTGMPTTNPQKKYYGIDLHISSARPERTHYTFLGWGTSSSTHDVSYAPGATYTLNAPLNLYAIWVQSTASYTVSYNANGGSGVPSSQTKWEDEDLTLSTIIPTWSGHTFFGWSTSSDRMAARQYTSGDTYTKNESVVLYAIWQVVVMCYSNGSQYGNPLYARIGGEITLPSPQPTATQVCTGWQRRDDTTITYTLGQTLEITISFILDAIWKNGFTLTYNDGGSGGGNSVVHTPLALTYDIWTVGQCHFTKAGSYFLHWAYTDDDGFPQTIKPFQSFTPTRSLTLYAVWKARTKFYWHGSDQADATYFAVGERVDLAITATAWNAFLDFVNDVREDAGLARIDFHKVTAGEGFSAFDFNRVRNNIDPMIPNGSSIVLPSTVSAGDEIVTSQYNGSGSLKDAINQIVDQL